MTNNTSKSLITKRYTVLSEVRESEQEKLNLKHYNTTHTDNRTSNQRVRKNKARFAPSATQKVARRIVKKYRNHRRRKGQTGDSLIGNLAKWEINMGAKAIIAGLEKKLVDEGIKQAPELYKYGTCKIKNKLYRNRNTK